jgi:hypothetical protein
MDVMRLPTNRIEQVRAEALDRAKVAVNDIVNRRNLAVQPPRTAP